MNLNLCQAAAAVNANARWQEMIAENLAGSSGPGSCKQEISFSAVAAGKAHGPAGANGANYVMPTSTTAVNFQQGQLRPTGLPTDVAIERPGFLEVQLPNGTRAFTRDDELQLNAQGQFVFRQDYLVLTDSGLLQLDRPNSSPIAISSSGEVSQNGALKG